MDLEKAQCHVNVMSQKLIAKCGMIGYVNLFDRSPLCDKGEVMESAK